VRVLGVDPGLTRCGLGVVDAEGPRRLRLVAVDVARTSADADIATRLALLEVELERWVREHRPDVVAVERVFSQNNVRTVMGTAQASAVALLVAARHQLPVALHTPSEVKAAVSGDGRADKAQISLMVTRVLGLDAPPRPADATDALALAICHVWRGTATARLAAAAATAPRSRIPTGTRARSGWANTSPVRRGGWTATPASSTTARPLPGVRRSGPRPPSSSAPGAAR
jgi:crossover junction endodeoxyribonuclease RuvC